MAESCVINTKLGKLRGKIASNYLGEKHYSFQGIPYAKAPVGSLRFKAPEKIEPWDGELDATRLGPACPSLHLMFMWYTGNENNCLNLNVYTKEIPKPEAPLRPVMVWIHGGSFTHGSNSTEVYGPEYLMTKDVVVVTINYRLGIFGFLCLEDESLGVTGNAGLKDQVMALQWVKEHISSFGGDPDNVTIYGESAGSASVHFLVLSPLAKGLFHKAIMQSGVTLCPWAFGVRGVKHLYKYLKTEEKEEHKILDMLNTMTASQVWHIQRCVPDKFFAGFERPFAPVVEKPSKEAFLSEEPEHIIRSGKYNKVPMIIGVNSNEAAFYRGLMLFEGLSWSFDCKLEIPLDLRKKINENEETTIVKKIYNFYNLEDDVSEESTHELKSDNMFIHGVHRSLNYHIETTNHPIYYYNFSFEGKENHAKNISTAYFPKIYFIFQFLSITLGIGFLKGIFTKLSLAGGFRKVSGCAHGDDLSYLFGNVLSRQMEPHTREEKTMKRMVKLWTNFAKYSNPTPENNEDNLVQVQWKPVEQDKHHCFNIADELTMEVNPFSDRIQFWNDIYEQYYRK